MYSIQISNFLLLLIIGLLNSQDTERSITYTEKTCSGKGVSRPIEGTFDVQLELLHFTTNDLHSLTITTNSIYNDSEIIIDTTYNGKNINIDICGYRFRNSGIFGFKGHASCRLFLNNNFDFLYITLKHKSAIDTFIVNYTKTKYTIKKISHSDIFNNDFGKEIILRQNP